MTYRVGGPTGVASLTLANESGNTEQIAEARVPWERSFEAASGAHLYVSAQNGLDMGGVRCEILINGSVIEQAESDGGHTIATCSGIAP